LRLSDARPVVAAMVQASVWIAEAQLQRARIPWMPTFHIGFDDIRHGGGGPDLHHGGRL
jgi:hypothetical protein